MCVETYFVIKNVSISFLHQQSTSLTVLSYLAKLSKNILSNNLELKKQVKSWQVENKGNKKVKIKKIL